MFEHLLHREGLSIERLHALVLLSEHGSLIKAAKGDAGTQSRYSHHIRELSAFMGTALTTRDGRSIRLTPAGEELVRLIKAQFQALLEFQSRSTGTVQQVVIGAEDSLLQWLLIPALGAMRRPGKRQFVKVENLRTGDLVRRLQEQRVDLGLLRSNAVPEGLKSQEVCVIKHVFAIPRRFALRGPTLSAALKSCPIAALDADGEKSQSLLLLANGPGATFKPELVCDSISQCLAAVRTGSFAAVLPIQALEDAGEMDCDIVDDKSLAELDRVISIAWSPRNLEAFGAPLGKFKNDLYAALAEEVETRGMSLRNETTAEK
jgi:DNA-binding transcriptional LysR family regulator